MELFIDRPFLVQDLCHNNVDACQDRPTVTFFLFETKPIEQSVATNESFNHEHDWIQLIQIDFFILVAERKLFKFAFFFIHRRYVKIWTVCGICVQTKCW